MLKFRFIHGKPTDIQSFNKDLVNATAGRIFCSVFLGLLLMANVVVMFFLAVRVGVLLRSCCVTGPDW